MLLGFKQFFDTKKKEPTWFREKILAGVHPNLVAVGPVREPREILLRATPKYHTIRLDPHNRWKPRMSIQMVYRGPKYSILDHFNKGIPELETLKSKQKIELKWCASTAVTSAGITHGFKLVIWIDGQRFDNIKLLAVNDGFNDQNKFCQWFSKDVSAWILHWTDLKY